MVRVKAQIITGVICISLLNIDAFAQSGIQHQPPTLIERNKTEVLEFRTPEFRDDQIAEAVFFSMSSVAGSFNQQEVRIINGRAEIPLLISDSAINSLEYYLMIRLTDGTEIFYPDVPDGEPPFLVNVVDSAEEEELPVADFIDYIILSPVQGEAVSDDDLLIAIALFYDDEDVENGEFRLILNGDDVTDLSEISPFVIKHTPQTLADGNQSVRVVFDRDDTSYEVTSWNFRAMVGETVIFGAYEPPGRRLPSGNVELGVRNQEIAGNNNDALTGRVRVSGSEGDLRYSLNGYLTTQEDSRLQPQNRYSADIQYSNWFKLQAGDVYPYMSDMTITGRRVRGINTELSLLRETIGLQFLMGRMNRSISNIYDTVIADETDFGTLYRLDFENGGQGMYKQDIIGGRMSFGREDSFRFSLYGMKIEDDTTSINVIRNYQDLIQINPALASELSQDDQQFLLQNSEELQVMGGNPRPRGNLVAGSELKFAMDNQRFRFKSEAGVSLLNQDISNGILTRERADELGIDLSSSQENLFDRISWLIIINENMSTLPFQISNNVNGNLDLDPFFPAAILASDSRLNLNYFGNQLEVRYRWIGPDYQSLANNTVQRDVAGISITDRFRFLQNRFYVTLGFESLNDNLVGDRQATTSTTTYSGSFSWFPVRRDLPRVNISTRYTSRDNSVQRFNPFVGAESLNASVRNFEMINDQVVTSVNPRNRSTISVGTSITQNFDLFDMNHQAIVSYGIVRTDDKVFDFGDNRNHNFSTRISTRLDYFEFPMRTRFGFNSNRSESSSGLSTISINGFDAGLEAILMDGSLSVNTDFAITRNNFETLSLTTTDEGNASIFVPSEISELDRRKTNAFIVRMNAQYNIHSNHAIAASANITNIRVSFGETGSVPSDRVLQLRYILNF